MPIESIRTINRIEGALPQAAAYGRPSFAELLNHQMAIKKTVSEDKQKMDKSEKHKVGQDNNSVILQKRISEVY